MVLGVIKKEGFYSRRNFYIRRDIRSTENIKKFTLAQYQNKPTLKKI
jgi:hypothetical protein